MEGPEPHLDLVTFTWRIAVTLLFVLANGFFVAAEFALVKVRGTQLEARVAQGLRRARVARHLHTHLDRYLSACQLGITICSLILGWLAEPAVAEALLAAAAAAGWEVSPTDPWVHGIALALALAVVTTLHMTLGEQAPKIWAISRAESTALAVAYPLQVFAAAFRPFIWALNELSNGLLRLVGLSAEQIRESSHTVDELRSILSASAAAGYISGRHLELVENILGMIGLEVRHILVPRVDVAFLSLQSPVEENLRIIGESGHSRFPLCRVGLDSVVGFVHAKDVMRTLAEGKAVDLEHLARNPIFVSDTQPLSRLILRMQRSRSHVAVVLDEHGTAVGLVFLEDAIEEIVGPIRDEFDAEPVRAREVEGRAFSLPGSLALPEAAALLGLPGLPDEADTIGGYVVATLGRLPRQGDELELGGYRVTVADVSRRRIIALRFEPLEEGAPRKADD
jgi:CBS domain containing-hemolysin-like protein